MYYPEAYLGTYSRPCLLTNILMETGQRYDWWKRRNSLFYWRRPFWSLSRWISWSNLKEKKRGLLDCALRRFYRRIKQKRVFWKTRFIKVWLIKGNKVNPYLYQWRRYKDRNYTLNSFHSIRKKWNYPVIGLTWSVKQRGIGNGVNSKGSHDLKIAGH